MIRHTTMKPTKAVPGKAGTGTTGNDEISQELLARIKSTPPGGLSQEFRDKAFWLSDWLAVCSGKKYAVNLPPGDWPWVIALDQFDRLGNKGPLQQLLKSGQAISPRVRRYLADLELRSGSPLGRPRTPAYMMSKKDALLMIACESVGAYVHKRVNRMSLNDALDKVAKEWNVSRSALDNRYNDRGSFRKSKKRL